MPAQVLWNSTRALPVAVVIGVAMIVAVFWLYPPQVRDLRGPWRWGLPALRAVAVLALAGSLLKPAVLRPKTVDERPAVIVLVDRSRSMAVIDNARTPAQLVALADGLGRLPRGARTEAASMLAADVARLGTLVDAAARTRGDWEYARVSGRGVEAARRRADEAAGKLVASAGAVAARSESFADPRTRGALAALRDTSATAAGNGENAAAAAQSLRQKLADALAAAEQAQVAADEQLYQSSEPVRIACGELAKLSRFQLAGEALLRPETGLLATVGPRATVVGFTVSDGLAPLALAAEPGAPSGAGGLLRSEPDGHSSDVARAVRAALDRVPGREVAAVVFFSDGRQVGGEGSVTAGLSAAGVPVFTVVTGPAGATRDLTFSKVSVPSSAFVGDTVAVRAELRAVNMKTFATEISVKSGGTAPAPPAVAVAGQEGRPAPAADFQVRLDRPGAQEIALTAKAADGEATAENNTVSRWVKVLSQKVRVAAYAGSPGWDFQYLRGALSRTRWVELQSGVLPPGAKASFPLTAQQILEQDVLVLSDVPVDALTDAQWDAVYRMVSLRGGSAILVAGEAHLPGEYKERLVTANLLPYPPEMAPTWRMWPGEQPLFRLVPDPAAAGNPFLLPGDASRGSDVPAAERWQALPGLYRFLPIGSLKPTARALLIEAASGAPVLTETRVGAGRSFLFGANETWRWRLKSGERDQEQFWLQLVRHAAGEPYAVRSERLAVDLEKVAIETGESARVRVRVMQDPAGARSAAGRYHVDVLREGKVVQSAPLVSVAAPDAGRLEARVPPLNEGDYQVRVVDGSVPARSPATSPAATQATAPAATQAADDVSLPLHVGSSYEAELADVSVDYSILQRLAEASAGEFFTLDQVDRLASRVELVAQRRPRYVEQRLWDSPLLFAFVVGCLAAEWAARKRVGLA